MRIRRAKETDIKRIQDLLYQVCMVHHLGRPDLFRYGGRKYTEPQLREILNDEKRPIFVAENEEGLVTGYAFCILEQHKNDNVMMDMQTLYIDDLCVDEKLRGQHIGKTIYQAVLDYAREINCYNVTLNVWNCNPPAMRFYESCGLKPYKVGMETIL